MTMLTPMIGELQQEGVTTRRMLERVPADKLTWRPHPKSMSLGQLALHLATVPGTLACLSQPAEFEIPPDAFNQKEADSVEEILTAHDSSLQTAQECVCGFDDGAAMASWRLMRGGREILALPRGAMLRSLMLNHWYHHRGQLSVYLRMLEVAVPSIYGPSADENPFA